MLPIWSVQTLEADQTAHGGFSHPEAQLYVRTKSGRLLQDAKIILVLLYYLFQAKSLLEIRNLATETVVE